MNFTQDWFSHNIPNWEKYLKPLEGKAVKALEIGCFEGRATKWLLQNILTHDDAHITVCDTFEGAMEHHDGTANVDFSTVEQIFDFQVMIPFRGKVQKIKDYSFNMLVAFNSGYVNEKYDFVYIDGSHVSRDVLSDAVLAWNLLKQGGIMIFDDYEWNAYPDPTLNPKLAIDSFLAIFANDIEVLHKGYQVIIQRRS